MTLFVILAVLIGSTAVMVALAIRAFRRHAKEIARPDVVKQFRLDGISPYTLNVLGYASEDRRIYAMPNSTTGKDLRRHGLAEVRREGPWPYRRPRTIDDDYLYLTSLGEQVLAAMKGLPYVVVKPNVPAAPAPQLWTPGSSAFWLDPQLWERTPVLPSGRLDLCWMHLDQPTSDPMAQAKPASDPIGEYYRQKRERDADPSLQCIYKMRKEPCGRCTPCLERERQKRRRSYCDTGDMICSW